MSTTNKKDNRKTVSVPKKHSSKGKPTGPKQASKGGITIPPYCRSLELCSEEVARKVVKIDAPLVSSNVSIFCESNNINYYILMNTWLFQVKDVSGQYYNDLYYHIVQNGLIPTIRLCNDTANNIIFANKQGRGQRAQILLEDETYYSPDTRDVPGCLVGIISSCSDLRQILQLLRFPKRFCPSDADIVLNNGINSFLGVNEHCRITNALMEQENYIRQWSRACSKHIARMVDGYVFRPDRGFFSNGVASDSKQPLGYKLKAFGEITPNLLHYTYPIGMARCRELNDHDFCSRVMAVPKSYKTPRIIAHEQTFRQFYMQAIRLELEHRLKVNKYDKYLTIRDQEPNRLLCRSGSLDMGYATIDLSSASDSVSRSMIMDVFPNPIWEDMQHYISKTMMVPSNRNPIKVRMFSTSGSALTFVVESMMFLAICLEVSARTSALTGIRYLPPHVFGDDMIVDNRLYQTVIDVLQSMRFIVNEEKSFGGETTYRESCGVEYLDGMDTCTKYFPRTELRWKTDKENALASLCSLQHKLFEVPNARYFLIALIRGLEPRMTSHSPGTECADMWEVTPLYKRAWAPMASGSNVYKSEGFARARGCGQGSTLNITDFPIKWDDIRSRENHLTCSPEYPHKTLSCDDIIVKNIEMWRYRSFLMHGPTYEDELLRLLNVSEAPTPLERDLSRPKSRWSYIKE